MSFFSEVRETVVDLVTSNAERKTMVTMLPNHVDPPIDDVALDDEASPGYYRLWATSMYLEHDRVLHKTYFPAIAATITFTYGDDSRVISSIVTPMNAVKDINKSDAGNVVMNNMPLTPLIPFNGGEIQVSAALKSVESDDALKAFTEAMGEISKVVTTGPISTGLAAIDPINAGISRLLSLDGEHYISGFAQTYSVDNNPLKPGYIACINAPDGSIDAEDLWVKDGSLYYSRFGPDDAIPFQSNDYLLVQVETLRFRNDWRFVGKINDLFEEAILLIGQAEEGSADTRTADNKIRSAILEAYTSHDMTREQRVLVGAKLRNEYRENKGNVTEPVNGAGGESASPDASVVAALADMAFDPSGFNRKLLADAPSLPKSKLPTLSQLLRV